jgi:hypothetical protein
MLAWCSTKPYKIDVLDQQRMPRKMRLPKMASRPQGQEECMQIYQLFPAVTDAPEWQSSAFQGPVLVRAETEDHARDLVCDRYWIASKAEGRTAPWSRADLVQAAVLTQPRYPTDGRSMILEPMDQI